MNAAMVGLIDRALLSSARHLSAPEELVTTTFLREHDSGTLRMTTTSYPAYRSLRADVAALKAAAAWGTGPSAVAISGEQVDADTVLVSPGYFDLLGVRPHIGHIDPDAPAAVVSYEFWISQFRGDPDILERHIVVRGIDLPVSAVMPRGFSGHAPVAVDAWLPIEQVMAATPGWDNPYRNIVSILARVAPEELAGAAGQANAALGRSVVFEPLLGSAVGGEERRIAFWLFALSIVVLVIALANAGTLFLVRAAKRRHELAIRTALGAGRGRLILHLLGESLFVGLTAVGASVLLAYWLDESVRRVLLPRVVEREAWDGLVLVAATAAGIVAAVVALAIGVAHLPSPGRGDLLKGNRRRGVIVQRGLLVVQATLSVMLLAGAGMFGRSLYGLMNQDFGFTTDRVLLMDFEGPGALEDQDQVFTSALQRVRELPGVELATVHRSMPFGSFHVIPIGIPGRSEPPGVDGQMPYLIAATPEFLGILGIRIIEGRPFDERDGRGPYAVIVNETMARTIWPGESAIGKCMRIGFDDDFDPLASEGPPVPSAAVPCREVVGVARDVRQRSVVPHGNEARLMQYYVPIAQVPPPPAAAGPGPSIAGLLVKTRPGIERLEDSLRRALTNGRSDLPPARVRSYASVLERQVQPWQLGATLLTIFSALAVLLAAVGLYAAFAHAVVLRRREMAIRIAIGATPGAVRTLIFRDAVLLTVAAAALGSLGAFLAGRSIQSLLYGIVPGDPVVLGGAAALMTLVAVSATLLPARTAARTDPNALLKAE
jgi:predicted permease